MKNSTAMWGPHGAVNTGVGRVRRVKIEEEQMPKSIIYFDPAHVVSICCGNKSCALRYRAIPDKDKV